ncbi:ATP-binding protein [bacterium]|nr:ATP-binding protein [bacterium]
MLLSFSVKNWMSFRDETNFSMVASRERQHGERIPKIKKYQTRVLPIAGIYGGNASGKTNFFKALNFVKGFVTKGNQPDSLIPVEHFKLDPLCKMQPSEFKIEILVNEVIYEFSFAATKKEVIYEKLVKISSSSEKTMYHRVEGKPNFHKSVSDLFLDFAFKGTRDNQLFLTNSVFQKVNLFQPVYNWFKYSLELIAPDSRFEPFEHFIDDENPRYNAFNDMISKLDTGISRIGGEEIPFENIPLPSALLNMLEEDVKENMPVRVVSGITGERFLVTRKDGELCSKKLVTFHSGTKGSEIKFDMKIESDGSKRVIDLLPAFQEMSIPRSTKVYIIDEIGRSLHTMLTWQLLEAYLNNCSNETRTQLLFTTHDALLMDQDLLRRDEIWVTERGTEGNSKMISFNEYKDIRYDKNIRKSYLQGRLGGIPKIILNNLSTAEGR